MPTSKNRHRYTFPVSTYHQSIDVRQKSEAIAEVCIRQIADYQTSKDSLHDQMQNLNHFLPARTNSDIFLQGQAPEDKVLRKQEQRTRKQAKQPLHKRINSVAVQPLTSPNQTRCKFRIQCFDLHLSAAAPAQDRPIDPWSVSTPTKYRNTAYFR